QPGGAGDADADGDVLRAPRLGDDPGDVVEDRGVDVDGAGELDHVDDGRAGDDGGDGGGPVPGGGAGEDAHGGVVVRVTDRGLHEETVELGLRQPVGAGLLHRVLGGDDEEDRKSTRLNSSHVKISYAVFCLKKKNNLQPGGWN